MEGGEDMPFYAFGDGITGQLLIGYSVWKKGRKKKHMLSKGWGLASISGNWASRCIIMDEASTNKSTVSPTDDASLAGGSHGVGSYWGAMGHRGWGRRGEKEVENI